MLISFNDIFQCSVLPSKAEVVDRSHRVTSHKSLLRTWRASLTRCCLRVVFDPAVLPCVWCAHNPCQNLPPLPQHSTAFKHFRPQHSSRLDHYLWYFCSAHSFPVSSIDPCFAQFSGQHVFGCAPRLRSSRCAHAGLGSGALNLKRSRRNMACRRCRRQTTRSWPWTGQHKHS